MRPQSFSTYPLSEPETSYKSNRASYKEARTSQAAGASFEPAHPMSLSSSRVLERGR